MAYFLFLVLAPWLVVAADDSSCIGNDCAAMGRSVLQKRELHEELGFADIPNIVERTEVVNGIPIYLQEIEGTPEAEALLQGGAANQDTTWLLELPANMTPAQVHGMAAPLAASGLTDEWEGATTNTIIMKGTKSQVADFLSKNSLPTGPNGAAVEQDATMHAVPVERGVEFFEEEEEESRDTDEATGSVPWGLDRIDDVKGRDGSYSDFSSLAGKGVHVYVLDTGVRTTHRDFQGRATPAYDAYFSPNVCPAGNTKCARDVHGHGTHCAGTVAGASYGVAKQAKVYGVRILNDRGSGTFSGIMKAMEWVSLNGQKPAVMSMSLGGPGRYHGSKVAVDAAKKAGVTVVVAAGNDNKDACQFNPAYVPAAITVGSTQSNDARSFFSNYGTCIDIWAPGSSIVSAGQGSDTHQRTMSGTSMACPHVSGATALILAENPTFNVDQVTRRLLDTSVSNAITSIPRSPASPNKFLNVQKRGPAPPPGTGTPTPGPTPGPAPPTTTTTTTTKALPGPDSVACNFEGGLCKWSSQQGRNRKPAWMTGTRTSSHNTGPQRGGIKGSKFAYLEASSPNYPDQTFTLTSNMFNSTAGSFFSFWYNMYGRGMGTIKLETLGGGAWTNVWEKSGNLNDKWIPQSVPLPAGATTLRFSAKTARSYLSDFALDDLSITSAPLTTTTTTTTTGLCQKALPGGLVFCIEASKSTPRADLVDSSSGVRIRQMRLPRDPIPTFAGHKAWNLDNGYLQRVGGTVLREGQHYTHAVWVYWRTSDRGWRTLLRPSQHHSVLIKNSKKDLGMYVSGRGGGFKDSGYDITNDMSKWQLVVVTGQGRSATSSAGTSTFYTAAEGDASVTKRGTAPNVVSGTTWYRLGAPGQGPGKVAAVFEWNRALSVAEINAVLSAGIKLTGSPTTLPPTTQAPTTLPPTTQAPTTLPPTTMPPTTLPPTTQAPTTLPPTTLPPTTLPPTTQAPTTLPPTTQAPTTLPPTTQPPATTTTTTTVLVIPVVVNVSQTDHVDINISLSK